MKAFKNLTLVLVGILLNITFLQSAQKEITEEDKKSLELLILGKTVKGKYDNQDTLFTKDIDGNLMINRDGGVSYNNCFTNDIKVKFGSTAKELDNMLKQYGNLLIINSIYSSYGIINVGTIQSNAVSKILSGNTKLRINKKCKDNGTTDLQYGSANTSDILAVPRFLYPYLVKTNSYADLEKTHEIIDIISFNEIKKASNIIAEKIKNENNLYADTLDKYKKDASSKTKESVGSVVISVNKYGDKRQKICTLDYNGTDGHKIIGYRAFNEDMLFDSLKGDYIKNGYSLVKGRNLFDKTFKDINSAYLSIKKNNSQCNIFIDYPYNIVKLKNALEKDKYKTFYGKIFDSSKSIEKYAISNGYESKDELDFALKINASLKDVKFLRKYKANNLERYIFFKDEMVKSKYSDKADDVITVQWFIYDKENGLKKNLTANQERKRRVEAAKVAKANKLAADKKARANQAKAYPYEAILSCGYNNNHINIAACFVPGKYGAETQLELKNGNFYKMYKSYQLRQAGKETRAGLVIPLRNTYQITAQNSSKNLLLSLKIKDKKTGRIIYQKSGAKYRVVSHRKYR